MPLLRVSPLYLPGIPAHPPYHPPAFKRMSRPTYPWFSPQKFLLATLKAPFTTESASSEHCPQLCLPSGVEGPGARGGGRGAGPALALPLGLYAVQLTISWAVLILLSAAHTPGLVRHQSSAVGRRGTGQGAARPPKQGAKASGAGQVAAGQAAPSTEQLGSLAPRVLQKGQGQFPGQPPDCPACPGPAAPAASSGW